MSHISDHPYHRQPWSTDDAKPPAERVFVGPALPRHSFVDDDGWGRLWRIELGKRAAFSQRDVQGAEVSRADAADSGVSLLTRVRGGTTFDDEGSPVVTGSQRSLCGGPDGFYAGQDFDSLDELLI